MPQPLEIQAVEVWVHKLQVHKLKEWGTAEVYIVGHFVDDAGEPQRPEMETITDVREGQVVYDTRKMLYRSGRGMVPENVQVRVSALESDQDVRDAGELFEKLMNDEKYATYFKRLRELAGAGNPSLALATEFLGYAAGLTARLLKANRDDQLCVLDTTLSKSDDLFYAARGEQVKEDHRATMWWRSMVRTSEPSLHDSMEDAARETDELVAMRAAAGA